MDLGNSREFTATEIIVDTQTEIMELVKVAVRDVGAMFTFRTRLEQLLDKNLKDIKNEELRRTARKSLESYAFRELQQLNTMLGLREIPLMVALATSLSKEYKQVFQRQINDIWREIGRGTINQAFSQLGNSQAMVKNNQSLYGHSELVARYEERQNMLARLQSETNLVICDTHSDCSARCFPWQGKVYSLDGTYGTTSDGRKYQPLENATDVRDKYGYKNGLLGFNCRHKLVPYKNGLKPIKVTKQEQIQQNEITTKQRLLEREIRTNKDLAISFKGIDNDKYKLYKAKSTRLTAEYKEFCRENGRVEYRSRIKV